MTILSAVLAAAVACSAAGARPTPEAAAQSLRAVFTSKTPSAEAGPLLGYLSFESRAADSVTAALRAQASEFLATRMPMDAEARFAWAQQAAVLARVREHLDDAQRAGVEERYLNMARSRRAEVSAMVEAAARQWLGFPEEAAAVAAPALKSNVVALRLQPRPTAPERKLRPAAPLIEMPAPEVAALLAMARKVNGAMGWGRLAVREHTMDVYDEPLDEGERAVVVELHGNPAAVVSLDRTGMAVGFGRAISAADKAALAAAGVVLKHDSSDRVFRFYHDETPLKDAAWFQAWRKAHLQR